MLRGEIVWYEHVANWCASLFFSLSPRVEVDEEKSINEDYRLAFPVRDGQNFVMKRGKGKND